MPSESYSRYGDVKDNQAGAYNKYALNSEYTYDEGTLVLPVAGVAGSLPRIVRTHAPIGYRTVKFDAHKTRCPPMFPKIATNTPAGDVFLCGNLNLPLPYLGTDQSQRIYQVTGEYKYVQAQGVRGSDPNTIWETGEYPFATPLIEMMEIMSPSFANENVSPPTGPKEPNWKATDWKWFNTSICSFFMSDKLID